MTARAPAHVLLVDDADGARMTLAALLENAGHRVTEAVSVAHGRQRLEAGERFDLVVLDLQLPDGRGTDLLPVISTAQPAARVAVLSASAYEARGLVELALEKSVAAEELVEQLGQLIARGGRRE